MDNKEIDKQVSEMLDRVLNTTKKKVEEANQKQEKFRRLFFNRNFKYLVFSDIHGSGYYVDYLIKIIKKEKPNAVILLGDLYYHGPLNELTREYNPKKVAASLNKYSDIIWAIRGNCDADVDNEISNFNLEDHLLLTIENKRLYFTHGDKVNMDNYPNEYFDVLIYGHYHTGFIKKDNNKIFVNSGSISLPKNNTKNSYLLIDEHNIYLKDLDNNIIDSVTYK